MFRGANLRFFFRKYSSIQGSTKYPSGASSPPPSTSQAIDSNVPGLSSRVVKPASSPVGPGASHTGEYKVPEYYCYNRMSYHEAEIELAKYRLPQPSATKK